MSIDETDRALFRQAVGHCERIVHDRDRSKPKAPPPKPKQHALDEARVLEELAHGDFDFSSVETGEEIQYLHPTMGPEVLKRLRKGQWRVQDEIDLHEMTVEVAKQAIREFLDESRIRGLSCVKIIHGKGLRSGPEGPKLKRMTAGFLARHSSVMAFASAPTTDGGTGAVHVLVKHR